MKDGNFYFIKNQYFVDFPDDLLMKNKENINGIEHGRPCFYALKDAKTDIFWMIPISSQVDKFKEIYKKKVLRYGSCFTISFCEVLGHERAFLVQNMCPVSEEYVDKEYQDSKFNPVRVPEKFEAQLLVDAKRALALQRCGKKVIFPDVLAIEATLIGKIK